MNIIETVSYKKNTSSSSSSGTAVSGGSVAAAAEGHTHSNKGDLDKLGVSDGYLTITQTDTETSNPITSKTKAGFADEASHAANASQADDATAWDGNTFSDYINQGVRTFDSVHFGFVTTTALLLPNASIYGVKQSDAGDTIVTGLNYVDTNYLSLTKHSEQVVASPLKFLNDIEADGIINALKGVIADVIKSSGYSQGALGSGFKLGRDGNDTYLEVDRALFRKSATFIELIVQSLKHAGGEVIISPASMHCTAVEPCSGGYKCYFKNTDNEQQINNEFAVGDLARAQTFNLNSGSRYYWRKVIDTGDNYITLSKLSGQCDVSSCKPEAGDDIVQLGNVSDSSRQTAIVLSSRGSDAPSIKMYKGINSFKLEDSMCNVIISRDKVRINADEFILSTGQNVTDYIGAQIKLANNSLLSKIDNVSLNNMLVDSGSDKVAQAYLINHYKCIESRQMEEGKIYTLAICWECGSNKYQIQPHFNYGCSGMNAFIPSEPGQRVIEYHTFAAIKQIYFPTAISFFGVNDATKWNDGTVIHWATLVEGSTPLLKWSEPSEVKELYETHLETRIEQNENNIALTANAIKQCGRNLLIWNTHTLGNDYFWFENVYLENGKNYTITQFKPFANGNIALALCIDNDIKEYIWGWHDVTSKESRTFNFGMTTGYYRLLIWAGSAEKLVTQDMFKLEEGNFSTPLSCAPEDTINSMAQLKVNASEISLMQRTIGSGENLLPHSSLTSQADHYYWCPNSNDTIFSINDDAVRGSATICANKGAQAMFGIFQVLDASGLQGKEVTISAEFCFGISGAIEVTAAIEQLGLNFKTYQFSPNIWQRISNTYIISEDATQLVCYVLATSATANSFIVRNVKIEIGGNATPYTPSLLDTGIDIKSKQITITADNTKFMTNKGKVAAMIDDEGLKTVGLRTNLNTDSKSYIDIKDGMMCVYGMGQLNMKIGVNELGNSVLEYYKDGIKLYDLGPQGITQYVSRITAQWVIYYLYPVSLSLHNGGYQAFFMGENKKKYAYVHICYQYIAPMTNGVYQADENCVGVHSGTLTAEETAKYDRKFFWRDDVRFEHGDEGGHTENLITGAFIVKKEQDEPLKSIPTTIGGCQSQGLQYNVTRFFEGVRTYTADSDGKLFPVDNNYPYIEQDSITKIDPRDENPLSYTKEHTTEADFFFYEEGDYPMD